MFFRAILHFDEWEKAEDVNSIPVLAISDWATKNDSNYSIFKDAKDDSSKLNGIALRLFCSNPKAFNSFCLLPLSDDIIHDCHILSDSELIFGCIHSNIQDADFSCMKTMVEYTKKHILSGKIITLKDLKECMDVISDEELNRELYALTRDDGKVKDKINDINRILYKREKNKRMYLHADN